MPQIGMLDMASRGSAASATRALVKRIEQRIADLQTNPAAASKRAGLGSTAVHDIVSGKNQNPSVPIVKALAKALDTTVAYLVGEQDHPQPQPEYRQAGSIPIIGVAETGAFRRMVDFDQGSGKLPKVIAQKSTQFPAAKHFALKIRGDSMNTAKPYPLLDGMVALCVDFVDAGIDIESGRVYAVRRTLDGGQTYECTIKRAKVFRDRYELHPESSNGEHKPLLIPRGKPSDSEETTIEVIGIVYGISFEGDI